VFQRDPRGLHADARPVESVAPPPRRRERAHPPAPPPPRAPFRPLSWLLRWTLVLGVWCAVGLGVALLWFSGDLPDISKVAGAERRPSVTLMAADGAEFARFGDVHSAGVSADALPKNIVDAVIAIEDRRFRYHFGIDPIGLARALYVNYQSGRRSQGGSTLTQQLAKNLFLTPEKSIRRKIQEAMLALWLERRFTKNQILAAYLNRVYLGAGAYGVDAAARVYFGKSASEVTLREAAIIAGLLKAPSRYSPSSNPDEAETRARVVLSAMVDGGFITDAERSSAAGETSGKKSRPIEYGGYFADWAGDLVEGFLGKNHGDVVVWTTMDPNLQLAAERRVADTLAGPGVKAKVGQAAIVSMTPDGAVRALVGGRDYASSEFNRAIQAMRQPGSSFKPFIYLTALQAGVSPDDPIEDAPVRIGNYAPRNYDGKYRGTITVAQALAQSSNVATLRLLERVGVDPVRRNATAMGVSSKLTRDLSLALGTSEVTPLDLTRAYAAIASRGVAVWPYAVTRITAPDGTVLYERKSSGGTRVADPATVETLVGMMRGVVETGTGKAAKLPNRVVAGKSGTTNDSRDAWFLGFTDELVTGVWMGNDDDSPMNKVTGGGLPAKLWHDFMADALTPGSVPKAVRQDAGIAGLIDDLGGDADFVPQPAAPKPAKSAGGGIGDLIDSLLKGGG